MEEDGAAQSAPGRRRVPGKADHHVVEMVTAPHLLCRGAKGQTYRPIVAPAFGCVAPAIIPRKRNGGQSWARHGWPPVGPKGAPFQSQASDWGRPVAFALDPVHAAAAESRPAGEVAEGEDRRLACPGKRPHPDLAARRGRVSPFRALGGRTEAWIGRGHETIWERRHGQAGRPYQLALRSGARDSHAIVVREERR